MISLEINKYISLKLDVILRYIDIIFYCYIILNEN